MKNSINYRLLIMIILALFQIQSKIQSSCYLLQLLGGTHHFIRKKQNFIGLASLSLSSPNRIFQMYSKIIQSFLILLLFLLKLTGSQIPIHYDNTTLAIATVNSYPISTTNSSVDQCRQLILKSTFINSLSSEGTFQNWVLGTSLTNTLITPNTNTSHALDATVSETSMQIINSGNDSVVWYSINSSSKSPTFLYQYNYQNILTGNKRPVQNIIVSGCTYYLCQNYSTTDVLFKVVGIVLTTVTLPSYEALMYISPDEKLIALCQPDSVVFLYNALTNALLHTFTPAIPVTSPQSTNSITFDSTSSLMIIETDAFNPVLVVSCSNYSTVFSFTFSGPVKGATFFNGKTDFIAVMGDSAAFLFDTRTSILHEVTGLLAASSVFATDYKDTLFICSSNVIQEYTFSYGVLSQSINTTNSSGEEQISDADFYFSLQMSQSQRLTASSMETGILYTLQGAKSVALLISSSPFLIYFLGFINYLNLCSIYVLLNMPIPEDIYSCVKHIFNALNENFFSFVGLNFDIKPISQEKVNKYRPLYFGITSDLASGYCDMFTLMIVNTVVVLIFQFLACRWLRKTNILRQYVTEFRSDLLMSQIINSILPLTLPWSFILLRGGFTNYQSKLNMLLYSLLFFFALFFPIYYLFLLIQDEKRKLLQKGRAAQQIMKIKISKAVKITLAFEDRTKESMSLSSLITLPVLRDFFACLANYIYPFLVLLKDPAYFLIGIQCFTVLNLILTLRGELRKYKNCFVLMIYPCIFNASFLVFHYSSEKSILIYAQLISLSCLLLGLLHLSISFVCKNFQIILKVYRYYNSNRVSPNQTSKLVAAKKSKLARACSRKMREKSQQKKIAWKKESCGDEMKVEQKQVGVSKLNTTPEKLKQIKIRKAKPVRQKCQLVFE